MKPRRDGLLTKLEREVQQVLNNKDLSTSERLKAIEVGAKILGIRHKIDGEGQFDGSFFANK